MAIFRLQDSISQTQPMIIRSKGQPNIVKMNYQPALGGYYSLGKIQNPELRTFDYQGRLFPGATSLGSLSETFNLPTCAMQMLLGVAAGYGACCLVKKFLYAR